MSKTLYVSDLDGTLLHSNEKISEYSSSIINELVKKGMLFSYATARSLVTAQKVTNGLYAEIPLIVYNGAFIINNKTKQIIHSNYFSEDDVSYIKDLLSEYNVSPIVYSYHEGIEKFSFNANSISKEAELFLNTRKNDFRRKPVNKNEDLYLGNCFYFSCIGDKKSLSPINDILKNNKRFNCIYQKDIYSGHQWLEILPLKATKANAILKLKELFNCERIIAFGDGINDISMFKISDECYATKNACPELIKIATKVIDSNNNDCVAKWLSKNVKL